LPTEETEWGGGEKGKRKKNPISFDTRDEENQYGMQSAVPSRVKSSNPPLVDQHKK